MSIHRGQDSCLVTMDTSGIETRLDSTIWTLLEVSFETEGHLLVGTVIFGYLTIFKKCQASSSFEALYSVSRSRCQSYVRLIGQMRWRPRAFSTVSTGDSDILSSCDMKIEGAFKALHGNPAFFQVRESRGPFHLKHKTQGHTHIHIPEGILLLRCLWKVGLPLQSKTGKQLSSPDDISRMEPYSSCFTEIDVPLDLRWVSQGISGFSYRTSCHLLFTMWKGRW